MSESIDDRVVSIEFDNRAFERNIAATLISLGRLQKSLDFTNSTRNMNELSAASKNFNLGAMASAVENISSKFSAMGAIGFSVIQNLTQSALGFASKIGSDILSPIITGGKSRAENIEQAKFQFQGLGIDVEKGMKSALDAVKGTSFGLDEAAKAAAQFGASGIKVGDQMTHALRGIAGAAAMTGKSFSEIADIYTGSAGSGVVNNQDLGQFATRGLNAAAAIAKSMGITEAQVHQMATDGKLDFKTFADAMDKAFGEHATKANEIYAGALANVHAAMSRLGASFFGPKQEQQRDLFNALTPVIDDVTGAMQPLIKTFLDIRRVGVDKTIGFLKNLDLSNLKLAIPDFAEGFKNSFAVITQLFGTFKAAFRDVFPKSSVSVLLIISAAFKNFTGELKSSQPTLDKLRDIFRGFFSVLDIGWTIIKELALLFYDLYVQFSGVGSGALNLAQKFGIMLQVLDNILVGEGGIHKFFLRLGDIIRNPGKAVDELKDKLKLFFESFKFSDVIEANFARIEQRFSSLSKATDKVSENWGRLSGVLEGVKKVLDAIWTHIRTWFSELGQKLADSMKPGDFDAAVDILNVGLLGGIAIMLKKFIEGFKGDAWKLGGGLLEKVNNSLEALTGKLEAMEAKVKAETLMKIAIAVGVLSASVLVLSLIDSVALTKALTAMAAGFGELVATMAVLDKMASGPKGAATLAVLVGGMIGMAGAMLILSGAIKVLSTIDPGAMAAALAGMSAGLAAMVLAMNLISANSVQMLAASISMVAMATALTILAGTIKLFSMMSGEELAKGIAAIAGSLLTIGLAMNLFPVFQTLAAGAAMIPLAIGLTILAGTIKLFGSMDWGEIGKGLVGIGVALILIANGMSLMPITLPITAAGMVILAIALNIMAKAIESLGNLKMGELAKGLGALAVMLGILVIAVNLMSGALAGAVAMVVVSGALLILTEVLERLGAMKLSDLAKGIGAIAAVLAVLGIGALLLAPAIPEMLALGVALSLIGAGFALFGSGAFLVGKALEILTKVGVAGVKALVEAIKIFLTAVPTFAGALVKAIVSFVTELVAAAPLLLKAVTVLLLQVLDTIITIMPKIVEALGVLIVGFLKILVDNSPKIIAAGFKLLIDLLLGIMNNISLITIVCVEIIVRFAKALGDNAQRLVDAGVDLLQKFLKAFGDRAADIVGAGLTLLLAFISGIADNIIKVIETAADIVAKFITTIADKAVDIVEAGAKALVKFLDGVASNIPKVAESAVKVIEAFIRAIADNAVKLAKAAADALIDFINGLANAIRDKSDELRRAGVNIASAIIDGITGGLSSKAGDVAKSAVDVAKGALGAVGKVLGIASPSKEFTKIGGFMAQGMALGLDKDTTATNSAVAQAERIITAFQETLARVPLSLEGMDELSPVITPVLDLTQVRLASRDIGGMFNVAAIRPDVSFDQARFISQTAEVNSAAETPAPVAQPTEVKFEQHNYSPKALSTSDIYRNTKSQIALAKEELSIP